MEYPPGRSGILISLDSVLAEGLLAEKASLLTLHVEWVSMNCDKNGLQSPPPSTVEVVCYNQLSTKGLADALEGAVGIGICLCYRLVGYSSVAESCKREPILLDTRAVSIPVT